MGDKVGNHMVYVRERGREAEKAKKSLLSLMETHFVESRRIQEVGDEGRERPFAIDVCMSAIGNVVVEP